jgi:hypothetical protein
MGIKDMFKNKTMEVINKKGLHNLLSEQLPPKKDKNSNTNVVEPPIKVVQPKKTTQTTTPTQTSTQISTDKKVDPQIKELQNYLSVIRFFSPNGSRINLSLTKELYNDVLNYFDGLKDSEPNITLLQALISFLIESERYNVSSFDAPQGYQSQIEMLIQENIITLTSGLKNILLEQAKRVGYVVKSGKIQKQTQTSTDGPSTAGPPTGPLIEPKKTTPPVPPPSTLTKPNDGEKVTQQEVQQTLQNNVNIKEIKKYSDRIKTTETPRYEACDNLFDNYESQLKLLKRQIEQGLIEPPKGDEPILQDIKTKLKWCYTSSEGKLRFKFKFKQMSSLRDENIKNAKGEQIPNPFKVNI